MFENLLEKSIFGKLAPGMCRLTATGKLAVKTSNGYKSYDVESGRLTNQSNFVFDIGEDFFFVIPTNKVKTGDIILINNNGSPRPNCVISAEKNKIEVLNFESGTIETVVPERHVFMGNTYFYGKIVSLFGSGFKNKSKSNNMFKMMMQMQLMQSMFGKDKSENSNGGMMQSMMMMSMMNGSDGMMGGMFDEMFDFDDEETEDETKEEN